MAIDDEMTLRDKEMQTKISKGMFLFLFTVTHLTYQPVFSSRICVMFFFAFFVCFVLLDSSLFFILV